MKKDDGRYDYEQFAHNTPGSWVRRTKLHSRILKAHKKWVPRLFLHAWDLRYTIVDVTANDPAAAASAEFKPLHGDAGAIEYTDFMVNHPDEEFFQTRVVHEHLHLVSGELHHYALMAAQDETQRAWIDRLMEVLVARLSRILVGMDAEVEHHKKEAAKWKALAQAEEEPTPQTS